MFKVKELIETGTFMGINARLHAHYFKIVRTIEVNKKYYDKAKEKLKECRNVIMLYGNSSLYLSAIIKGRKTLRETGYIIFYLDAHFYNPEAKNKFVVLEELEALKKFKKGIIVIHDFDNGEFGHITYDGISLNFELLKDKLYQVNPNFWYYKNTECDIVTDEEVKNNKILGLEPDFETLDNIKYALSKEDKGNRGLLYCIPCELKEEELKELRLRKL